MDPNNDCGSAVRAATTPGIVVDIERRTPIDCPECGKRTLQKLGEPGKEVWMCPGLLEELAGGKKIIHKGLVWDVSYIIRCPESIQAIKQFQEEKHINVDLVDYTLPGDVYVDRAMKAVYLIAPDGSRRRVKDPETIRVTVEHVKKVLAEKAAVREAKKLMAEGAVTERPKYAAFQKPVNEMVVKERK